MSFFASVEAEFKKLFSKAPTWDATALTTIKVIAPLLETALALVAPEADPVVIAAINEIETDLAAVSATIKSAGATPTLTTTLSAIQSNLSSLEAVAQIKDSATQAKLSAIVSTVSGEISAIASSIPTVS